MRYWEDDDGRMALDSLPATEALNLNLHTGIHFINGRRAHEVEKYVGTRVSVVWYTHKCVLQTEPEVFNQARNAGFRPPSEANDVAEAYWFAQPGGYNVPGASWVPDSEDEVEWECVESGAQWRPQDTPASPPIPVSNIFAVLSEGPRTPVVEFPLPTETRAL